MGLIKQYSPHFTVIGATRCRARHHYNPGASTIWTSLEPGVAARPTCKNLPVPLRGPASIVITMNFRQSIARYVLTIYKVANQWGGNNLATETELCDFLENAERRAFKQAAFAVRDDHTSLDIAQDAMFKLIDRYRDRRAPAE
jgi:hypothetical protein